MRFIQHVAGRSREAPLTFPSIQLLLRRICIRFLFPHLDTVEKNRSSRYLVQDLLGCLSPRAWVELKGPAGRPH